MSWMIAASFGTAVIGGVAQNQAAKKAAGAQTAAADKASQTQLEMFYNTQQNLAPWMGQGQLALSRLSQGLGLTPAPGQASYNWNGGTYNSVGDLRAAIEANYVKESGGKDPYDPTVQSSIDQWITRIQQEQPQTQQMTASGVSQAPLLKPFSLADFQESPAYQFNLNEGRKAIEKSAATRGMYYAPQTLQDVAKYSQGLASNEFNNAYNQYNQNMKNVWDRLYALSGSGQNAAAQTGAFGTTVGGQVGENTIGAGNAQAAGAVGQANAITGALGTGYNAYVMNQILANNQRPTYTGSQTGGLVPMQGADQLNQFYA